MANKLISILQEDLHFERKGDSIIGTHGSRWYSINRTSSNTISLATSVNIPNEASLTSFIDVLKQLKKQLKFRVNHKNCGIDRLNPRLNIS